MKKILSFLAIVALFSCKTVEPVKISYVKLFKGFNLKGGNSLRSFVRIKQIDVNPSYIPNMDTSNVFKEMNISISELENKIALSKRKKYHQKKMAEVMYGGYYLDEKQKKHYILFTTKSMVDFTSRYEYWF
jgi:hypothetical protein